MESEKLTAREAEILNLVVLEYVREGRPVSSLHLTGSFDVGVSSATVRSVLVDLERKGYLYSPHRSAGRIPTEAGYRFYVERLPSDRHLDEDDRVLIQKEYLRRGTEPAQILDVTCRLLSMLSNHVGVVIGPEREKTVLKHIELIDMGQDELLIVVATRSGLVYSKSLHVEDRIPGEYLRRISQYLNSVFKGCDLEEVRTRLAGSVPDSESLPDYFPVVARTIAANFDSVYGEPEFYTSGLDRLYGQIAPERPGERTNEELGDLLQNGSFLRGLMRQTTELEDVVIVVEGDHDRRLSGLSVVTASYKMGERKMGTLGVIGPNRMDYSRVVSLVQFVSRLTSGMLTRISN